MIDSFSCIHTLSSRSPKLCILTTPQLPKVDKYSHILL